MKKCVEPLLIWYYENKRELPWRIDKDPYHVWVSEIMLQQTRIEAVKGYYMRFIKKIPDIHTLAIIDEEVLLKLWEGLGYYNRARNLKKAAIQIEEQFGGNFPKTYQEIIKLPGIGEYTAGAISSICFQEKQVAIDGNVLRVYMRIYNSKENIDNPKVKKQVGESIKQVLPNDSGSFNEALMELGELICLPNTTPQCQKCPIKKHCIGYQKNTMETLPIRNPKKQKRIEKITILLFYKDNKVNIEKRLNEGLLKNMWQFPNLEGHLTIKQVKNYLQEKNISYKNIKKGIQSKHIFTHKIWDMVSYQVELEEFNQIKNYTLEEIKSIYALPTAFEPFLKEIEKEMKKV